MSHITREQRYTISVLLKQDYSQTEIGNLIGKDKSVISREIMRNCDFRSGEYRNDLAQRKYEQRQAHKSERRVFTQEVQEHVESLLKQDYSPKQIVGISKKENITCVSHESIYQHMWKDK